MVFAINCGADGAPNSFTNFKASALAVGASLSASAAAAASTAAPAATSSAAYAYTTAAVPAVTTAAAPAVTTAATTASAAGAVHTVVVGGTGILAFNPPFVSAAVQDTIVFELYVYF